MGSDMENSGEKVGNFDGSQVETLRECNENEEDLMVDFDGFDGWYVGVVGIGHTLMINEFKTMIPLEIKMWLLKTFCQVDLSLEHGCYVVSHPGLTYLNDKMWQLTENVPYLVTGVGRNLKEAKENCRLNKLVMRG